MFQASTKRKIFTFNFLSITFIGMKYMKKNNIMVSKLITEYIEVMLIFKLYSISVNCHNISYHVL